MSELSRLRRRAGRAHDRIERARVPERPAGVARIQPLLDQAQAGGAIVEVLDTQHVRLRYDARVHDQWVAIDDVYDAVRSVSTVEGDGQIEAAPDNWMVVHFDYGSCGRSLGPD